MENNLNENVNRLREIMSLNENIDMMVDEVNDPGYLSWKRKNVTIRGVKEVGEENNAGAMLGRGLYTAFLSNKGLAKEYGTVYFVLNAIPKNPKVFNTLNEWEIWFYNTLVNQYSKEKGKNFPDRRDFDANTTIEDEVQKMGFDGIIIKGREMVNFNPPDNVIYFKNEDQLINYYETVVNGLNEGVSRYRTDITPETLIKRVPFLRTFQNFSDKEKIMFQKITYNKDVQLYVKDSEPLFFKQFNVSSEIHYSIVDMGDNRHRFMLSLVHQTWLMPPDTKEMEQELTYKVLIMAMKKQMESFDYRFDEVLEQESLTEEQWNEIINKLNESFFKLENYLEEVLPVRLKTHLDENVEELIKMAHDAITRRKGKDYAPDVHELQAWVDNHIKDKKMNEAEEKEKSRIALLFIVIDNKVLLFKRSPEETTNPGKYGMLGGHIEKGESPEEALRREIKEEAGVELGPFKKLKTYELEEVQLNVFYTNEFDTENIKLDKKEHTGKKFFTLEELDEMSPEECIDTNKGIARDYNKKAQEDKKLDETILRMKSIINK
jgi:8-oxo-dGTP diphosphatase